MAELLGYDRLKEKFKELYDDLNRVDSKTSSGTSGKEFLKRVTAFDKLFNGTSSQPLVQEFSVMRVGKGQASI